MYASGCLPYALTACWLAAVCACLLPLHFMPALPASLPASVARTPVANHVEILSRLALQFIEVREGGKCSLFGDRGLILGGEPPV